MPSERDRVRRPKKRVMVFQDALTFQLRLPMLLERCGCEVIEVFPHVDSEEVLSGAEGPPDLIVVSIVDGTSPTLEWLRTLRKSTSPSVPILGVALRDRSEFDLETLRALGVVGLIDSAASPDHVVFRVNELVGSYGERRRRERVTALFPVELEAGGETTTEYAVSLSVAGMGINSSRSFELNTCVRLRFHPAVAPEEWIELDAKVIHCARDPNSVPPHRLGVFFYAAAGRTQDLLELEMEHLLGRPGSRETARS
jgi:DNA-binding response OmpR family regulator